MAAQLKATVYVRDPDSHQTVELAPGTCPEPRLAVLVPNPAAWVDGKLPRLPKAKTEQDPEGSSPSGDGSAPSADADQAPTKPDHSGDDEGNAKPAARKTAARKTAARKPAAD